MSWGASPQKLVGLKLARCGKKPSTLWWGEKLPSNHDYYLVSHFLKQVSQQSPTDVNHCLLEGWNSMSFMEGGWINANTPSDSRLFILHDRVSRSPQLLLGKIRVRQFID